MKQILLTLVMLMPLLLFGQDNMTEGWIETEGTIKEVTSRKAGRKRVVTGTVEYKTNEGKTHTTQVRLFALPIIGSLKKEGSKVTVLYDPANPMVAKDKMGATLDNYAWPIMIVVGVIFSLGTIMRMIRGQKQQHAL